jgi:hypothetical protein
MLNLNTTGFTPNARNAVTTQTLLHADVLKHSTKGTDDVLLGIMTPIQGDGGSTSVLDCFFYDFNLSLEDVRDAVLGINVRRCEDFYTETGASDGVSKVLRLARRNARKRARINWYTKNTVRRWDVLVGLIQTNDRTFQLVMTELTNQFEEHDFSFEKLEARVLRGVMPEAKAKVVAHA